MEKGWGFEPHVAGLGGQGLLEETGRLSPAWEVEVKLLMGGGDGGRGLGGGSGLRLGSRWQWVVPERSHARPHCGRGESEQVVGPWRASRRQYVLLAWSSEGRLRLETGLRVISCV